MTYKVRSSSVACVTLTLAETSLHSFGVTANVCLPLET